MSLILIEVMYDDHQSDLVRINEPTTMTRLVETYREQGRHLRLRFQYYKDRYQEEKAWTL